MNKYKSFAEFFNAFITGKIAVKSKDGKIGLYSNFPDWGYWENILRNIWNKSQSEG